jgi:hypothetical protein
VAQDVKALAVFVGVDLPAREPFREYLLSPRQLRESRNAMQMSLFTGWREPLDWLRRVIAFEVAGWPVLSVKPLATAPRYATCT